MENIKTTKQVSRILGVDPGYINLAIWRGKLQAPGKLGRSYFWTQQDIKRAARALNRDIRS